MVFCALNAKDSAAGSRTSVFTANILSTFLIRSDLAVLASHRLQKLVSPRRLAVPLDVGGAETGEFEAVG